MSVSIPVRNNHCSFHDWRYLIKSICHLTAAVPSREWCVPGSSVGFYCWWAGYLAVVVTGLILVRRVHALEFLHNLHFVTMATLFMSLLNKLQVNEGKSVVYPWWLILPIWLWRTAILCPRWACTWERNFLTFYVYHSVGVSTCLSQSFLLVLQSYTV